MSQNPNNYIGKHVRIYWDSEDDWFPGNINNTLNDLARY